MANIEIPEQSSSDNLSNISNNSLTTNDLEPLSPTKKKGFSREDMVGFCILVALYSIQGVPQGFFGRTIHILFIEKGAHNSDLGALALALMPYSFKFLLAPFMDTYYSKTLGKRKTYIIPMQYLFSVICFFLAFNITEEVKELNVTPVLLLGFVSNTIMAIQDIAVDGWAITILSQENVAYGALAQSIGLMLGGILAFNVFIPLSSVSFCNQYFFSTPQDTPVMALEGFWIWTGIITLIITVYVHFFQKEKTSSTEEITSVIEVIKTLKAFVKNVNLRQLVLVTITSSLTTAPIYALADTKLLQNGFPKEVLTNITTGLIPVQIFGSIFVSKLGKRKMEMKVKTWAYAIAFFNYVFLFWVVLNFDMETNYTSTVVYIILCYIVTMLTFCCHFVSNTSYANRICDETISGTFLTTLAALSNLGYLWPRSLSLYINEYVSWEYMGIYAIIATPIYFAWYQKQLRELDKKSREDFSVAMKSE